MDGCDTFHSKRFTWDIAIDEDSWRRGHNLGHHQYTNVTGKDPDIHFGFIDSHPIRPTVRSIIFNSFTLLVAFPNFSMAMGMHFSGWLDYYGGNGLDSEFDFIKDRSEETKKDVHRRFFEKQSLLRQKLCVLSRIGEPHFLEGHAWKLGCGQIAGCLCNYDHLLWARRRRRSGLSSWTSSPWKRTLVRHAN